MYRFNKVRSRGCRLRNPPLFQSDNRLCSRRMETVGILCRSLFHALWILLQIKEEMGKQGPCYHCGVTSTPLWRNGPPEKPVLCNACGSRWRTKGSLVNYTPLHARAEGDEVEIEDRRGGQKMMMINGMSMNRKRKPYQESFTFKRTSLEFSNGFKKRVLEEEASNNRSSSGSVVSNSESCDQSNAWETSFAACRKRTCVGRPKAASSSVEKLTKDLFSILQEQQSSCCVSGTSEEELLFENESPMVIGHGSVLLRDPREDSEASSLLVESSKSSSIHSHNFGAKAIKQEQLKRTKSQVLGRHSLPLCNIDLKYVFNFDEFKEKFTKEEQQTLMKLLPQVDLPDSLLSMFESSQFKENFSLFQQLVADGVFGTSTSSSGSKLEEVSNQTPSDNHSLVTIERPCESLNQNFSETRVVMKSPKEVMKIRSKHIETKEIIENSVSSLNHMSYGGSMVCGGYEDNDNSYQDLLLDVPMNGSRKRSIVYAIRDYPLGCGTHPQRSIKIPRTTPSPKGTCLKQEPAFRNSHHAPVVAAPRFKEASSKQEPAFRSSDQHGLTPREQVLEVLRLFKDVFRQLDRDKQARLLGGDLFDATARIDIRTLDVLEKMGKQVNTEKRIGVVPGVNVGDEFQYKTELRLVGLHFKTMCGIDYMNVGDVKLATSIVSSEGYGYSDKFGAGVVVYTGEGGNVVSKEKKTEDQRLVKGNLALANSMRKRSLVRVIRGEERLDKKGKRYVYDGLYLVDKYWLEKEVRGTTVYKFKLCKVPGQPPLC
ncbi:hypothetical protein HID58_090260 [Brassica napus]|uniref:YDG domain-containing protein n=1 Tax=Brassica napus TaxID=3708 RepID=A0ABQ7X8Z4_BRANA|nr:hypothetical protein HID58_090260 [Brassica napus]